MNEENNFGAPTLDDIDYTAPAPKKEGPEGVAAPVLDDFEYVAPAEKKGGPTGVAAPVLDDMDSYAPPTTEKKGAPTGVSAPVLDDDNYSAPAAAPEPEKLILSDEDIIAGLNEQQREMFDNLPEEKQQQIINMRREQLGAEAPAPTLSAPVLDEDNYVPPPKKEEPKPQPEEPISAPILDDEPEAPKYVPKFVDEDLERAKQEGAKKAVSGQLVSDQKDSKESLRMMLALKEERRQEEAAKGFKVVIGIAVMGIIAAAAFYLLYSGVVVGYKDSMSGMANVLTNSSLYIALAMAVSGITLISGIGIFKSIGSLIYLVAGIVQIFPGIVMIPQHEGNLGIVGALYAVALICTVGVIVGLSAIESVGIYFNRNKKMRV